MTASTSNPEANTEIAAGGDPDAVHVDVGHDLQPVQPGSTSAIEISPEALAELEKGVAAFEAQQRAERTPYLHSSKVLTLMDPPKPVPNDVFLFSSKSMVMPEDTPSVSMQPLEAGEFSS